MNQVRHTIQRPNGAQAQIVATEVFDINHKRSVDVFVLARASAGDNWHVTNDKPHPDWKSMPREDYITFGRSETLRTVRPGEIFKTVHLLNQKTEALQQVM